MNMGAAYYPEQWPPDRWPADAQMMREAGIDVVRVGDTAWSCLEPKRERFEFEWLQNAIEVLTGQGLRVILCTPTASAPVWLFNRHPSMRPVGPDGRPWFYGSRRDACVNNPAYRKYCRRIVAELGKAFGTNPAIWAWQVDNELGGGAASVCYCDDCEQAFRQWLNRRYGTIERLNSKWGTAFWGQTFTAFHDIPAPRRTPGGVHPSLALDYRRFTFSGYRTFLAEQVEIIRAHAGDKARVTTNSPGGLQAQDINQFALAQEEDVVSVSNYPGGRPLDVTAANLDMARASGKGAFWVMEQQAGATAAPCRALQPRPGQLRLWSYQAAARGAELISYFRWRTGAAGQQMHWQGMLDAGGKPGRRFEELRCTIGELKERASLWEGCMPEARVALVVDHECAWALKASPMGLTIDYFDHLLRVYGLLRRRGVQADFVAPGGELGGYRAVLVPMPVLCRAAPARQLEDFAFQGGRLLVTAPAGYRTAENTAAPAPAPGDLAGLLGVEVLEHDVLNAASANGLRFGEGEALPAGRFCSVLEVRQAEPVATYTSQYYAGSAAATVNAVGQGLAFFLGATPGPEGLAAMLDRVLDGADVPSSRWASETVEVIPLKAREGRPRRTFVLNHGAEPVALTLGDAGPCRDLLSGRSWQGEVRLAGCEVALLELGK